MIKDTIRLFMWGYQQQFNWGVRYAAERLFGELGYEVTPEVFLVGLRTDDRPDRHPVCIDPEDGRMPVEALEGVAERMRELVERDPLGRMHVSTQVGRDVISAEVVQRAVAEAVTEAFVRQDGDDQWSYYCGPPADVEGYRVVVVLRIPRAQVDRYYRLAREDYPIHELRSARMATSLLGAAAHELLTAAHEGLQRPTPGVAGEALPLRVTELARRAGERLATTPGWAIGDELFARDLYMAANAISSLTYERAEARARIVLARRQHPNVEVAVELESPIGLRDASAMRKMLEVATEDLSLLATAEAAYGFGNQRGEYDPSGEDLFILEFTGRGSWELKHAGSTLMHVRWGVPSTPVPSLKPSEFEDTFLRLFPGSSEVGRQRVAEALRVATSQPHGTIAVVTDHAQTEAARLSQQAVGIKPIPGTPELVLRLTAIDGAILIDPSGVVHAVGVILDGLASPNGDPGRGARYNSAIRYHTAVAEKGHRCFLLVVSEDGQTAMVPEFRPRIRRGELQWRIAALGRLEASEQPDFDEYTDLMNWFEKHRFYLSSDDCEAINGARVRIEEQCPTRSGQLRIVRHDLEPDPDMDDTYLLDE